MNLSRSPYIVEVDDATQTGSKVELYIWTTGSQPADPQYTLSKLIPASNNTKTFYNISPYIREYYTFTTWQNIYNSYDLDISTNYVVNYHIDVYNKIGGVYVVNALESQTGQFMDGYNYYMDGYNSISSTVLLSEGTYFYNHNGALGSAVVINMAGSFNVDINGVAGDVVRYTNLDSGTVNNITATTDGMKTFSRVYLPNIADGNKVEYLGGGSAVRWTGYFKPLCEPKYSPVVVDFLNRYGSWARVFFQKVNKRSVEIKTNEYKFNPSALPFFPTNEGQIKEFNTNGKETIKLNTGWVNDLYGEYLQELLLSEKVTLFDPSYDAVNYTPVKVKTKSLQKQTGLNDGMINYELDFEFAYDLIGTVV